MNAVRSGMYSLGGTIILLLISAVGIFVFSRLLTPEVFGIYAIVLAVHIFFQPFLDLGLTPAYLKIEKTTKETNSVFFMINIILGILISLLVIIIAPILSRFYAVPELKYYLWGIAIIVLLLSAGNQSMSQIIRQKAFDKQAIVRVLSGLSGLIAGIYLAWKGWGVWSLIIKFLVDAVVRLIILFIYVRPNYSIVGISLMSKYLKDIKFGMKITLSRLIYGYALAFDKLLLAKIYDFASVGHYERAFTFIMKPDSIRKAITTPALAHVTRMDGATAVKKYSLIFRITFAMIGLPCVFFFFFGDKLVDVIMGAQWELAGEMVRFFTFLAIGIIIRGLINIFHINEYKSGRLVMVYVYYIVITYGCSFAAYVFFQLEILQFVKIFSIIGGGYWLVSYFHFIYSLKMGRDRIVPDMLFVFLSCLLLGAFSLIGLQLFVNADLSALFELLIIPPIAYILTILGMYVLRPSDSKDIYQFVRSRIKRN